jgi:hypothetical protein
MYRYGCHCLDDPTLAAQSKNKRYCLNAAATDRCLSVSPWAEFRRSKGAIKLHIGLRLSPSRMGRALRPVARLDSPLTSYTCKLG